LAEVAAVGDDVVWFLVNDAKGHPRKYAAMKDQGGRIAPEGQDANLLLLSPLRAPRLDDALVLGRNGCTALSPALVRAAPMEDVMYGAPRHRTQVAVT